jgi:hypothetical protein
VIPLTPPRDGHDLGWVAGPNHDPHVPKHPENHHHPPTKRQSSHNIRFRPTCRLTFELHVVIQNSPRYMFLGFFINISTTFNRNIPEPDIAWASMTQCGSPPSRTSPTGSHAPHQLESVHANDLRQSPVVTNPDR